MVKLFVGIVIVLAVLVGVYFWSDFSKQAGAPSPTETMTPANSVESTLPPVTPTVGTEKEIVVSGNEFAFEPSTLILKKGDAVKITFKNTGEYPHNFSIADLGVVTETVKPGEQSSVVFTPNGVGKFRYTCTVGSHAEKGMIGTVTVQ